MLPPRKQFEHLCCGAPILIAPSACSLGMSKSTCDRIKEEVSSGKWNEFVATGEAIENDPKLKYRAKIVYCLMDDIIDSREEKELADYAKE